MSITKERWQEAQHWESQIWHGMSADIPSLLGIPSDYVLLQRRIGLDLLPGLLDDKDVLEIGVGPFGIGLTSLYLDKHRIKRSVKVEPLPRILLSEWQGPEQALIAPLLQWLHALSEEGEYIQATGETLGYTAEFDTVITANVLDHVHEPEKIVRNAYQALRPGGHLLVAVNCFSFLGYLKFEYITRKTMKGTILVDSHPHTFLPKHVQQMMMRCGFRNIITRGLPKTWWGRFAGSSVTTAMPIFIGQKPA